VDKNRPPQTCTLLSLPTEIIISIALHLSKSSPADFASLARTCSTLRYLPLPRSARYLLTLTAARAFQRGLWAQCRTPHQPPNQNDTFWLALEQAFIQPIEEALREESMGSSGREIWDWWSHGEGWRSRRRVWWSIVKGCAAARDAYWWLSKGLND